MNKFTALAGVAMLTLGGAALAQDMATPADPATDATTTAPMSDATSPDATPTTPSTSTSPTPSATTTADSMTTQPATSAPAATADATTLAEPGMEPAASAAAEPASTEPGMAPAASAATQPMSATPGSEPMKTASADSTAKVQAGWATYDKGNKGSLTALEFGNWIMAANGQDMTAQVEKSKTGRQANLPAVKVLNATSSEFAKADTDKSRTISPEELATYLG